MSIITPLSPKFLPSLINLECLSLYNYDGYGVDRENVGMQEWNKYLSIASFPNLNDYKMVERSHGIILAVQIFSSDL